MDLEPVFFSLVNFSMWVLVHRTSLLQLWLVFYTSIIGVNLISFRNLEFVGEVHSSTFHFLTYDMPLSLLPALHPHLV